MLLDEVRFNPGLNCSISATLPLDPDRIKLFESLYEELAGKIFPERIDKNATVKSYTTFAFFERYFADINAWDEALTTSYCSVVSKYLSSFLVAALELQKSANK